MQAQTIGRFKQDEDSMIGNNLWQSIKPSLLVSDINKGLGKPWWTLNKSGSFIIASVKKVRFDETLVQSSASTMN